MKNVCSQHIFKEKKLAKTGFDRSYKNFLTCLRIGEQRWSVRFAGIRPTQTRRNNRCTERQVEVSNRMYLNKKKLIIIRKKTIHYVSLQSYNIFLQCFSNVASHQIPSQNRPKSHRVALSVGQ